MFDGRPANAMVRVQNVSAYALDTKYWVVRCVEGTCWYYGAWDDEAEAIRVAKEVDGLVVYNE